MENAEEAPTRTSLDILAIEGILLAAVGSLDAVPEEYRFPTSPRNSLLDTDRAFAAVRMARIKLASRIELVFQIRDVIDDLGSDKDARNRADNLYEITRLTENIQTILKDRVLRAAIARHLPHTSDVLAAVSELGEAASSEMEKRKRDRKEEMRRLGVTSLPENEAPLKEFKIAKMSGQPSVMVELARIYKDVFDAPATIKYNSEREELGPFIEFVRAIYSALNLGDITPGAIRKALDRGRKIFPNDRARPVWVHKVWLDEPIWKPTWRVRTKATKTA